MRWNQLNIEPPEYASCGLVTATFIGNGSKQFVEDEASIVAIRCRLMPISLQN
jgi:hypothetical protein